MPGLPVLTRRIVGPGCDPGPLFRTIIHSGSLP